MATVALIFKMFVRAIFCTSWISSFSAQIPYKYDRLGWQEAFFRLNIIQGSLLWGNICIFKGNNTTQTIINNRKRSPWKKVFFQFKVDLNIDKTLGTKTNHLGENPLDKCFFVMWNRVGIQKWKIADYEGRSHSCVKRYWRIIGVAAEARSDTK